VTAVKYSASASPERNEAKASKDTPGPGEYKIKTTIGEGPKAVILGKPAEK